LNKLLYSQEESFWKISPTAVTFSEREYIESAQNWCAEQRFTQFLTPLLMGSEPQIGKP
jgi:hypothetical protein